MCSLSALSQAVSWGGNAVSWSIWIRSIIQEGVSRLTLLCSKVPYPQNGFCRELWGLTVLPTENRFCLSRLCAATVRSSNFFLAHHAPVLVRERVESVQSQNGINSSILFLSISLWLSENYSKLFYRGTQTELKSSQSVDFAFEAEGNLMQESL